MELTHYLDRIRYEGPTDISYETLRAIHRAHLLNLTYENLDIHRGLEVPLDQERFYQKIVEEGRGGWCYEMNGLFAWALKAIGFPVTLLGGSVGRQEMGDVAQNNHLCLLVELDQPYLADVGFGNGILEPLPLQVGRYDQRGFVYELRHEGEYWHFINPPGMGPSFDFTLQPYSLSDFAERCHYLQSSPDSGFVRVAVCYRQNPQGFVSLKGATLRTVTPQATSERVIETQAEYESVLQEQFDITLPNSGKLWQKVWQDHQAWVESQP